MSSEPLRTNSPGSQIEWHSVLLFVIPIVNQEGVDITKQANRTVTCHER